MKTVCLFLCATIVAVSASAQNLSPFNSGEVIEKGIDLHKKEDYKKAVAVYNTVPQNDTNYVKALYQKTLSLLMDSNYKEALTVCEQALELESVYKLDLAVAKGTILDDRGTSEEALKFYDSIHINYPDAEILNFNRAVTLIRLKRQPEAEVILQKLVLANPYYYSAHLRLANCALHKGRVVPAMLSLFTYLVLNPNGYHSKVSINLLSNLSKGTGGVTEMLEKREKPDELFGQA